MSSADIRAAVIVVQQSLVKRGYGFKHVYLVDVIDHNEMLVYYTSGYGTDEPVKGELSEVRRVKEKWRITQLMYYDPNIIVQG